MNLSRRMFLTIPPKEKKISLRLILSYGGIGFEMRQRIFKRKKAIIKSNFEEYNFKIVAFDSYFCNPANSYLIIDPTDPA